MRRVNLKLLLGLVAGIVLVVAGVHGLHVFQAQRNAGKLLKSADQAEKSGRHYRAQEFLDRYLYFHPDDPDVLARYAESLSRTRNRAEANKAVGLLERAVRLHPDRAEDRRKLARLELELGRLVDVREHAKYLLENGGEKDGVAKFLLAACELEERKFDSAIKLLKEAKTDAPDMPEIYPILAELLREQARPPQPAEADQVMNDLIAANAKDVRAYLERSRYREKFKLPGAEADAQKALEIAPENIQANLMLAHLAEEADDLPRARKYREEGLKVHPNDPRMYYFLERLERRQGDRSAARDLLKTAVTKFAGMPVLKFELASVDLELGDFYDAKAVSQALAETDFEPELQQVLQAKVEMGLGNWEAAEKKLVKVRPLLVGTKADEVRKVDLLLARCYQQLHMIKEMRLVFERMLTADPGSQDVSLAYAQALDTLGLPDDAIEVIRKAPDTQPDRALALAALLTQKNAKLPVSQQRWNEVEQALNRAEQLARENKDLSEKARDGIRLEVASRRLRTLKAQRNLEGAQEAAEKFRDANPDQLLAWLNLADILEARGQYDKVLPLLEAAEKKLGDKTLLKTYRIRYVARRGGANAVPMLDALAKDVDKNAADVREVLIRELTDAYQLAGDQKRSTTMWDRLVKTKPDDLQVQQFAFELANRANDEAGMTHALAQVRRIENEDGPYSLFDQATYLVWKASAKGDKSGLSDAQRLLATVSNKKKDWPRVSWLLAQIAELNGDTKAALEQALAAIYAGERNPNLVRRTLELLYKNGRFDEAANVLARFEDQPALSGELQRYAAEASLRYRETDQARALAERAVSPDSKDYRDQMWLGQMLAGAGRQAEAEQHLRQAVELGGDEPVPWIVLVNYLATHGERPEAIKVARNAEARFTAKQQPVVGARCLELAGEADKALELYRAALAARPDDDAILRSYIDFLLRFKRLREAEAPLERLISLQTKPSDALALKNLYAEVLAAQKDPERAKKALALVASASPATEKEDQPASRKAADNQLRARINVLASQGDQAQRIEAIRLLEELVAREQTAFDRLKLAELYERQGNWPKAKESLIAVTRTENANPGVLVTILEALIRHNETAEAKPWLDQLEKLEPNSLRTAQIKAGVLHGLKQTDQAVALLEDFAERNEKQIPAIALTFERLKLYPQAEAMLQRAAAKNPEARLILAEFLGRRDRLDDAFDVYDACWGTNLPPERIAQTGVSLVVQPKSKPAQRLQVEKRLQDAVRKEPANKGLLLALASVHYFEEHYDQSEVMYRRALTQDQNEQAALNNLAWLLGHVKGKEAEGLELVQRAIASVGPQAALIDTRGVIYLAMGEVELALKDLESATAADPQAPAKWFHLAQAYWAAKRRDDADKAVKQAIALGLKASTLDPMERSQYQQLTAELGRK